MKDKNFSILISSVILFLKLNDIINFNILKSKVDEFLNDLLISS